LFISHRMKEFDYLVDNNDSYTESANTDGR